MNKREGGGSGGGSGSKNILMSFGHIKQLMEKNRLITMKKKLRTRSSSSLYSSSFSYSPYSYLGYPSYSYSSSFSSSKDKKFELIFKMNEKIRSLCASAQKGRNDEYKKIMEKIVNEYLMELKENEINDEDEEDDNEEEVNRNFRYEKE